MSAQSTGPLTLPETYQNYVEKHEILHLFQRMYEEVIVQRPQDPLQFLINYLSLDNTESNKPRVIVCGERSSDEKFVSTMLALKTRGVMVSREDILELAPAATEQCSPELCATIVKQRLEQRDCQLFGWILTGYPINRKEAICLQELGVLAEHVLLLTRREDGTETECRDGHAQFSHCVQQLVRVYPERHRVLCVERGAAVETLCAEAVACVLWRGWEVVARPARLLLLGVSGSGRRTQAQLVAQKLGLVHVDCEQLVQQQLKNQTPDGAEMERYIADSLSVPDLLVSRVVKVRLQCEDCRQWGWVLTGFPSNLYQAILMMDVEIFPNKVVQLSTPVKVCRSRLESRYCDPASGGVIAMTEDHARKLPAELAAHLRRHDQDRPAAVGQRLDLESRQLRSVCSLLSRYTQTVDGCLPVSRVCELIQSIVASKLPAKHP